MQTIEFAGVNDLLNAVSGAIADRDARIDTLEELLAERPTPDPALLALARLGAAVANTVMNDPSADVETEYLDLAGVMDNDRRWYQPGIADAIARLLAPDGADGADGADQHEGVTDGD